MKTYPINLVLENKLVVLIGAKGEIVHRIPGLLAVNANIRVIAPTADPIVAQHALQGDLEWLPRRYQPGDLTGAALVVASANNHTVHDQIWAEGTTNGQLVNVMDVISQSNFHGTSVMRQGQLTISVGTGGAAPALAVTLRKRFEKEFGPEYSHFLDYAQTLRPIVAKRISPFKRRVSFWYDLINSDVIDLIRHNNWSQADDTVQTLLTQYSN